MATQAWRPGTKAQSAHTTFAGAFFVPAKMLYGGLRMDFFGSAGSLRTGPPTLRSPSPSPAWRQAVADFFNYEGSSTMTKGIPDPPQQPCCDLYAFGTCNNHHAPMFTVRPGVFAEDALVHAIQLVQQAYQSTTLAREDADKDARRLLGSTQLSLEMIEALLNKVLDGLVLLPTTPAAPRRPARLRRPLRREDFG